MSAYQPLVWGRIPKVGNVMFVAGTLRLTERPSYSETGGEDVPGLGETRWHQRAEHECL